MKMRKNAVWFLIIVFLAFAGWKGFIFLRDKGRTGQQAIQALYFCPMHPNFTSDKPGNCGICGMNLVKNEIKNKPLYYRNPMDPAVTSPVPAKDSMGMEYVAVYDDQPKGKGAGIYISPERLQTVGIKTEKAEKRNLTRNILTVGKVSYNPGLYVAQEEYLQALKSFERLQNSTLDSIRGQSESLLRSAEKRLLLQGMSAEEIKALASAKLPQESLYLPSGSGQAWVYVTIYEHEIGLIKEGLAVEIDAQAFPGKKFTGKIIALTPVLDAVTRSIQVRAEVNDPQQVLMPDMFVNVKIDINLGGLLSVSEEAVINTGKRMIVVVRTLEGTFISKDVVVGQKAEGYFEVIDGLVEGETVVTAGNFLIDSESRLQQAISGEHKQGQ